MAQPKIAPTLLFVGPVLLLICLSAKCVGQNCPLDRVAPYPWSKITRDENSSESNHLRKSPNANNDVLSKEPLFDQVVRPFELATDEDAAVRNGDRYKFGANGRQSGQRLKIETAKLPFESTHFESLNLAVVLPGSPWVKLETPARWVNGGVMMARSNPDIMVMLNGEATGIEMKMDVRILAKAAKAKLTAISSTTAFTSEKDETINGIRGRSFEASMIGPTRAEYWLVWVGEHNGYSYELVFVGDPKYTQEIGEASSDFRHGMRMIDPKRVRINRPAISSRSTNPKRSDTTSTSRVLVG